MDAVIQESLKKARAHVKSDVPWAADEPCHQAYYSFSHDGSGGWTKIEPSASASASGAVSNKQPFKTLALCSWNIDFMLPFATSRMKAAIEHLQGLFHRQPEAMASVIYLQECVESDLTFLASQPWIRKTFYITDLDPSNWQSGFYGTVTLIDRRLPVTSCFRVHYSQTRMERDAFFVDICMGEESDKLIRLCNTHLESLALDPPYRPSQIALVARYMQEATVYGAAVAGDFNAIQDFDRQLHSENSLRDAYLELGGEEDSDEGYTWGQQAATQQRDQFGCSRMDKVFFCGGLNLTHFETFGADVEVGDAEEQKQIIALGFDKPWITDHLGVMAQFVVVTRSA